MWRAWVENENEETREALEDAKREIARARRRVLDTVRKLRE